jgi:hypothetical protein
MASRGFRGKEARIKFSADVSALERVKGVLGRLFSYIGNQSVIAAKKAQAIEQAMEKVAKKEAAWQRVVSESISTAERRGIAIARADEQITRAKERLGALTQKQEQLARSQSVQYLRTADRVAKAEESVLRAREQGLRISEKQASQLRNLQKFQDNLDKAKVRGSTRENRLEARGNQARVDYFKLEERKAAASQRFANTETRIANTIINAEEKLNQRKQALARLDLDRQTESARESERIASKRVNLAQQTAKLLEVFGEKTPKTGAVKKADEPSGIARSIGTEKGLTGLITRLEGIRDKLKLAKNDIAALEFDKQIAGAQHLLNLQKQFAKFTDETNNKRETATNAVLRSERDLRSLNDQKQANEKASIKSADTYDQRLSAQRDKVHKLNTELRTVRENNEKAAKAGTAAAAQLSSDYKSQIASLSRLHEAREEAAKRYLRLEKDQQVANSYSQKIAIDALDKEIAQQNRKIDLTQKAYDALKRQNTARTADGIKQQAAAQQAVDKENEALNKLLQTQQQLGTTQSASSSKFLGGITQSVSAIGAGRVAMLALGAAGATAFSIAQVQAVKLGMKLETLRATFIGLTGDIVAAQNVIDTAFDISQELPVDPAQLLEGARTLLSVGAKVQGLSKDLRALSVIATVANQPMSELSVIYGEILNKNRLYREDLLQFSRRGIPLMDELARMTGKTRDELDELVSLGAIKFETFQIALQRLGAENSRYGSAVAGMANSTSGQVTLLANSWANFLKVNSEALESLGVFEVLKFGVIALRSSVDGLTFAAKGFRDTARTLGNFTPFKDSAALQRNAEAAERLKDSLEGVKLAVSGMDFDSLFGMNRLITEAEQAVEELEKILRRQQGMNGPRRDWPSEEEVARLKQYQKLIDDLKLGIDVSANKLSPKSIEDLKRALEELRVASAAAENGLRGVAAPGTVGSVAEVKAKEKAVKDIDKYLEDSLTTEQRMKLAIAATNEEFDKRLAANRKAFSEAPASQRPQLDREKLQLEKDRQTVLEQINLERGKEIRDMHEEAKLAKEIAGWTEVFKGGGGVKIPGEAGFSVIPEDAQEKVATYLVQIERLRAEATAAGRPFEFTNAEIQKQIALLNELALLEAKPKETPGQEKLKETRADADEQKIILDLLRQGETLQEAQDEAAVRLLEKKKEITAQEALELRLQQRLAREAKNRVDILEEAKTIAEKVVPGKTLLDQFRSVNIAVQDFGLGLADAEAIMQKMFIDALGLQSALNFKSQKIGLPDIGQHIQELALSQQNNQSTQFLKEIRDLVKRMTDGELDEDIIKAINDMARDFRRKAGVAG